MHRFLYFYSSISCYYLLSNYTRYYSICFINLAQQIEYQTCEKIQFLKRGFEHNICLFMAAAEYFQNSDFSWTAPRMCPDA